MNDEDCAYDRAESLGEWRTEQNIPEPDSDEYWAGVE